jgi:hypothetical protein
MPKRKDIWRLYLPLIIAASLHQNNNGDLRAQMARR